MRKLEVQRGVERHVAPLFPELEARGDLLATKRDGVLHGFVCEGSGMAESRFKLHVFAQMLSFPLPVLILDVSAKLGDFGSDEFERAAHEADRHGRAFLARVDGLEAFAKHARSLVNPLGGDESARVGRVHCLIRLGDSATALDELAGLDGARGVAELHTALQRSPRRRTGADGRVGARGRRARPRHREAGGHELSYGIAAWEGQAPASDRDAEATFERLYEAHVESGTEDEPTPRIEGFVNALLSHRADLGDLDDDEGDDSPWTDEPLIGNASGPLIYFAVVASRAGEMTALAAQLAKQHELVCFDPQEARVVT